VGHWSGTSGRALSALVLVSLCSACRLRTDDISCNGIQDCPHGLSCVNGVCGQPAADRDAHSDQPTPPDTHRAVDVWVTEAGTLLDGIAPDVSLLDGSPSEGSATDAAGRDGAPGACPGFSSPSDINNDDSCGLATNQCALNQYCVGARCQPLPVSAAIVVPNLTFVEQAWSDGTNLAWLTTAGVYTCALSNCTGTTKTIYAGSGIGSVTVIGGVVFYTSPTTLAAVTIGGSPTPTPVYTATGGMAIVTMHAVHGSIAFSTNTGIYSCAAAAAPCTPTLMASTSKVSGSYDDDGTNVYWIESATFNTTTGQSNHDGAIFTQAIGTGPPKTLASGLNGPQSIAHAGANVYWVDPFDGYLYSTPTAVAPGTPPTQFMQAGSPYSLVVDGSNLFFTGAPPCHNQSVVKVDLCDGTARILSSQLASPFEVFVDASMLYVITNPTMGNIVEMPK
jgi:hypothetical protein